MNKYTKHMVLVIMSVLVVAATVMILPVPAVLVAPMIIVAGWVIGKVGERRLNRMLDEDALLAKDRVRRERERLADESAGNVDRL